MSSDNFVVVNTADRPTVVGEVAFPAALTSLHEKAIYMHDGRLYHVERFEYDERKAYVKPVRCDYYTDAIEYVQVESLEGFGDERLGPAQAWHGEVRVTRRVVGFKKIRFQTNENVGAGKLSMPEQEMHTTALRLHFPASFLAALRFGRDETRDGLLGLGNVLRTVTALTLMCDLRDIGVSTGSSHTSADDPLDPEIFLYDNYPGGMGQSEPAFRLREDLAGKARDLLAECSCNSGCPRCVGAPGELDPAAKDVAKCLASSLVGDPGHATGAAKGSESLDASSVRA